MKDSKEEEAGQMDGGPQGDPTRGKKEEKKLLQVSAATSLHESVYIVGLMLFGWGKHCE